MPSRNRLTSMFNAVAIVSALHFLSEGMLPAAEGTGEPYGINRQVVEGAARAGAMGAHTPLQRGFVATPVPALSQVADGNSSKGEVDEASSSPKDTNSTGTQPEDTGSPGKVLTDEEGDYTISLEVSLQASIPDCNKGRGQIRYERIIDTVLEPSHTPFDSVRLSKPPIDVLRECADLCLKDKTSEGNLPTKCMGFDFLPGHRINSYSHSLGFTESKCLEYRNPGQFEDIRYKKANGSFHLREVCYEAAAVRTECPSAKYVVERVREMNFLPFDYIEIQATTIEECQDKCLSQYADDNVNNTRVCRAGCFDHLNKRCYHSSYTRRTHPRKMEPNPNFDYFENTCLSADRRCPKNKLMFLKETNKELAGSYDTEIFEGLDYEECKAKCLDGANIFCRSMEVDEQAKICVISDEDSNSRPDGLRRSVSDKNKYYELVCIDGNNVKGDYVFEDSDTQQLNQRKYRDVRTAFEVKRNSRLQLNSGFRGSREKELLRMTLAECLDACLEERSFTCRSVAYSGLYQICRLSEYDQLNGNLDYDGEYDYYENLMENLVVNLAASGSADSNVVVAGERQGVAANRPGSSRGVIETGPGSAGQTGLNRPLSSGGFSNVGESGSRVSSTNNAFPGSSLGGSGGRGGTTSSSTGGFGGQGFGNSNDRFNSRGSQASNNRFGTSQTSNSRFGANDDRRFRPSGLFNPISTDFRNQNTDGRQTGSFGFDSRGTSGSFGTDSRRQTQTQSGVFGGERQTGTGGTRGTAVSPMDSGEVSQLCTEDGMEFTLRTNEPFRGRIYTYGYYDRCFSRGSGSTVNILKISGPNDFPDCGTIRYGETTTNIVVVQFSDNVQTSLDKRYNLTCTIVGPGEAVVTSGYIGAGSGAPTPIEYLPAENQLQSKVRLQILYGGRPTTTIAVGDPLTFKLESQRGFNLVSDIFATNVVAKDPYSGRSVDLIDSRGCPIDSYVFPSLGRGREGNALEARFNAFKIPESNFLIFEATVRTCRGGCQPARCVVGPGREEVESYGRRRRNAEEPVSDEYADEGEEDEKEQVHGIYEVYMSREEIDEASPLEYMDEVCIASSEYYSLVAGLVITALCLMASFLTIGFCYRKQRQLGTKNALADAGNPYHSQPSGHQQQQQQQHLQQKSKFAFPGSHARTLTQPASYFPSSDMSATSPQGEDGAATSSRYPDPSEPIYTDPGLFERAKSQRGETASDSADFSSRRRFAEGED